MNTSDYARDFSETSLWKKLTDFAATAGREVVEKVLVLFETMKDPDTPRWAKGVIVAALGYFISPIDAIPDLLPFAGYADDLGALAAAVATVAAHIKKEHLARAKATVERWFDRRKSEAKGDAGVA
jgi:uncharacterized membrane protein YkvA (DUF1232 family)